MNLDVELLSRIQFAVTIGFHFLFPPISIGLAWLLVIFEMVGWKKNDEGYVRLGKFFGKLLGITFAVGVATGVVMEFQFGTNWAQYSKFVGDIFGAPLAAEGIFAFFLESGFLGLYLFGRGKVSKSVHWFSALMVAVGATISAFWIIVANSWQQTPAGFVVQNGRAELTNFAEAVFNPSTLPRFFHTVDAALITGAFFVAGVAAYLIRKDKEVTIAKKALKIAVVFGLVVSLFEVFPFGDNHARQVAATQPEKFAAMQGLFKTETGAPLVLFGIPSNDPPELKGRIGIPGLLSWMTMGDVNGTIKGMNEFPADHIPPIFLTFASYHIMVGLGLYFILVMAFSVWQAYSNKMWNKKWLLKLLTWSIPLPLLACQLGWIAAEVGRQPWIVYKLMRTRDAFSAILSGGEVLFSLILFSVIYILIGSIYLFLLRRELNHGPEPSLDKEVLS
jgi:cytochrome bd ubiquinol oxidase subunit I